MMLFARPGKFEPCGMFTKGHFELILITIKSAILLIIKKDVF